MERRVMAAVTGWHGSWTHGIHRLATKNTAVHTSRPLQPRAPALTVSTLVFRRTMRLLILRTLSRALVVICEGDQVQVRASRVSMCPHHPGAASLASIPWQGSIGNNTSHSHMPSHATHQHTLPAM